jgi:hypothetical protein
MSYVVAVNRIGSDANALRIHRPFSSHWYVRSQLLAAFETEGFMWLKKKETNWDKLNFLNDQDTFEIIN